MTRVLQYLIRYIYIYIFSRHTLYKHSEYSVLCNLVKNTQYMNNHLYKYVNICKYVSIVLKITIYCYMTMI